MEKLKFKKGVGSMGLSEDFFYMINKGGWCSPEIFLEESDALKIREAIKLIDQYEQQGIDEGYFEEM